MQKAEPGIAVGFADRESSRQGGGSNLPLAATNSDGAVFQEVQSRGQFSNR